MPAATILFTDIVGFSKKSTAAQKALIQDYTRLVERELKPFIKNRRRDDHVLALPTGDGMVLVFLHNDSRLWNISTLLKLITQLQKWAYAKTKKPTGVYLRIGVHVGSIEMLNDINGRPNFCGDTINYTQRVMDSAGSAQVIFSEEAFREYVGVESKTVKLSAPHGRVNVRFEGPIDVYAKHGLQIPVYRLALLPEQKWWSNAEPVGKNIIPISLTPLPKEIAGSFSDRLAAASDIAFVQLTGDRFLKNFFDGKIKFSQQLKNFIVFMPDPSAYRSMHLPQSQAPSSLVKQCIKDWVKFFKIMRKKHPNAQYKLGLFKEPAYYGASYINWNQRGGQIHVSPYVWNVPAPQCPGYDLQWVGCEPSGIYRAYIRGLEYLNSQTKNKLIS